MHNYLKKLSRIWNQEKYPPDVYEAFIAHDDWCGINSGQRCNCDPDITINKKGENAGATHKLHNCQNKRIYNPTVIEGN